MQCFSSQCSRKSGDQPSDSDNSDESSKSDQEPPVKRDRGGGHGGVHCGGCGRTHGGGGTRGGGCGGTRGGGRDGTRGIGRGRTYGGGHGGTHGGGRGRTHSGGRGSTCIGGLAGLVPIAKLIVDPPQIVAVEENLMPFLSKCLMTKQFEVGNL